MTGATSEKTTQQHTNTSMLKLIVLTLYFFFCAFNSNTKQTDVIIYTF